MSIPVPDDAARRGSPHFRPDVEGLRALAVLLVIAFHVGIPGFSGGFVGVDVFFVISGYLITALLCREVAQTGTLSISSFLARRIRRLLPAAALVLVVTLLLTAITFPPLQMIQTAASARAAAAYVSNIHFARLASDYFSGDVRTNPMLHTWSLSVEEQFYLAWPWLILLFARPRQDAEGGIDRRRLAWALTGIGTLSFVAACWYTTSNQSLAFYATPLRAWEFACGGLASLIVPRLPLARRRLTDSFWAAAFGWIGVVLVVSAATIYSATTEFPGVAAMLPVAGTSMLLLAGTLNRGLAPGSVSRLLSTGPAQWIGRRSYSWYLWHWPILVIGTSVIPGAGLAGRVGFVVVALLLADLTYRFVETPTRAPSHSTPRPSRASRAIQLGIATTVIMIATAEVAHRWAIGSSQSATQRAFSSAAADIGDVYRDGCVNGLDDDRVRVCTFGAPSSSTTIALFGDSHAAQWVPALEVIARTRQWTLIVIAKSRCATADVPVYLPGSPRRFSACDRWRVAAMDSLRARRPALVILSNAGRYVRDADRPSDLQTVTAADWEAGLVRTLEQFHTVGSSVVLIRDTPLLDANVPICLSRSGWLSRLGNSCGTRRTDAINDDVVRAEVTAIAAVPGTHAIDLTNALCVRTSCPPMVGGLVAYSDRDHLTARMARSLAPTIDAALGAFVRVIHSGN
jgi:peptidoglycan/LPS O-acetylase OafA/YrhL